MANGKQLVRGNSLLKKKVNFQTSTKSLAFIENVHMYITKKRMLFAKNSFMHRKLIKY